MLYAINLIIAILRKFQCQSISSARRTKENFYNSFCLPAMIKYRLWDTLLTTVAYLHQTEFPFNIKKSKMATEMLLLKLLKSKILP